MNKNYAFFKYLKFVLATDIRNSRHSSTKSIIRKQTAVVLTRIGTSFEQ